MAVASQHIFRTTVFVALGLYIVHSQSIDPALTTSGQHGKSIAQKAINLVEATLGSTNKLLERTALVESKFGNDPRTYRPGYHGGIWQVDSIGFRDTQDVNSHPGLVAAHQRIQTKFGIDWSKVNYVDLRKPLYSAIAARLYYRNKPAAIPTQLSAQAKYWKKQYNSNHGAGSVAKFVTDVMFYDRTIPPQGVAGAGSTARGKKIFIQRGAQCHSIIRGKHKTGPSLSGICGKRACSYPGYACSTALKNKVTVWTAASLYLFLQSPKKYVPGTKMVFAGIKKRRDLLDVIAYLCSI